jgi:serine/threonine protein kinase
MNNSSLKAGSTLQNGKYEIIRTLGQGGFGITYEANQVMMDRHVCIKEFFIKEYCDRYDVTGNVSLGSTGNAEMVRQYMAKFVKEAKTIAKLNHPNIISIYDVFEENNTAYYVMEFLPGESLNDRVKNAGAIPEKEALRYIYQIGDALSYAHDHHVMHLDIKPSNIMLDGDRAVLIDFGLSKQYSETGEQTSSTPVGISHGYAPLEQYLEGGVKEFSPETDVYSLGATLYKLVTGLTPPPAPIVVQSGLPSIPLSVSAPVRDAIGKAMSVHKQERPRSVKEFLSILDNGVLKDSTNEDEDATVVKKSSEVKKTPSSKKRNDVSSTGKDGQLHPLTIGFLAIGLFLGLIVSLICLLNVGDPLATRLFRFAFLGTLIAISGLLLILLKKKIGFWAFISGGMLAGFFGWLGIKTAEPEFFGASSNAALPWILSTVAAIGVVTFLFLQIKNNNGVRGWRLLKNSLANKLQDRWLWIIPVGLTAVVGTCLYAFGGINIKIPSPTGEIEGHGYVDLGLPSGLLWATCNVGAETPLEGGDYYAWGETEQKDYYDSETYSYYGQTYGACLPLSSDVAHKKWGEYWRMPTEEEMQELRWECEWYYTVVNGVRGTKVVSRKNKNWIFFPAAGEYVRDSIHDKGMKARIWSAGSEDSGEPRILALSETSDIMEFSPVLGANVRPVTTLEKQ